jgi:hypothetical protein
MFKPEDIPAELPDEVKGFLGRLQPEPQELLKKRAQLLAQLGMQLKSATGTQKRLLVKLQAALLSLQPHVPFQASLAGDFQQVLGDYMKDPATPKPPPPLVIECMRYMQERVEAMGLGNLLAAVSQQGGTQR